MNALHFFFFPMEKKRRKKKKSTWESLYTHFMGNSSIFKAYLINFVLDDLTGGYDFSQRHNTSSLRVTFRKP